MATAKTETTEFTAEDQAKYDELAAKKAKADWQTAEDARAAELALYTDAAEVFTPEAVAKILGVTSKMKTQQGLPVDITTAFSQLDQVVGYAGGLVAGRIQSLKNPAPKPNETSTTTA